jgi:SpoVK/Ycf46/Vps4 family AAA+-type ATPase
MATAEQIKALLKTHAERDEERFYAVALQVAAGAARTGHTKLAGDIKTLVERGRNRAPMGPVGALVPLLKQPKGDLSGVLEVSNPGTGAGEIVLSEEVSGRLKRVILEQRQKDKLEQFGLQPRRKLLFTGSPGTGKTMSAAVLATELKLPLYTILLDGLITRYMGETAAKLRLIFDHIQQTRAVYLFDEFDAIGAQRGATNDVGEIRRVLNSFLLFVEQDRSDSVIVAATNHPELLDRALHRRFDDIIRFDRPDAVRISRLIENRLAAFHLSSLAIDSLARQAEGLSCAEVVLACDDAAKEAVLHHDSNLTNDLLRKAIDDRQSVK